MSHLISSAGSVAAAQQALDELVGRLATEAELYGTGEARSRAERLVHGIPEADRLTVLAADPSLIGEVLREEETQETLAREIWRTLRYAIDLDAKRTEIGAAVRRLLWRRLEADLLYLVRCELERREQEREAREADPAAAAAREAGAPLAGEIP